MVTAAGLAGTGAGLIVGLKVLVAQVQLLGIVAGTQAYAGSQGFPAGASRRRKNGHGRADGVANYDNILQGKDILAESLLDAVSIFTKIKVILLDPV